MRIVSPENSSRFDATASVVVEAEANDPDGKIRKIEFYGTSVAIKLGEASSPPYRIKFNRKDACAGSFCARAFDEHGAKTDSDVGRVRVLDSQPPEARVKPIQEGYPSPGDPTKGWESVASIVELPNGDLLSAWFAGKYELSQAPSGARAFALAQSSGPSLRLLYTKSADGGKTWQPAVAMPEPEFEYPTGTLPSTLPQVLPDGEILLPVNREAYHPDPAKQWYLLFFRSANDGKTWTETVPIYTKPGNIQPTVAQLSDGSLLTYLSMRGMNGNVWKSSSKDAGKTWAALQRTSFPSPSARIAVVKAKSGKLILVYNYSTLVRTPLDVVMSSDEGRTWNPPKAFETGGFAFTYPYAIQSRDRKFHVVYDDHDLALKHAVIDEVWIARP